MENLPKKGPLFRELGTQKPTHMGGTYPYPQHVMYPPPPGLRDAGLLFASDWFRQNRTILIAVTLHDAESTCTTMSKSIVFDSCEAQLEGDQIGLVQLHEMECQAE